LNSHELERTDVIVIVFQAKLNDLAHAFHEGVESLGLGVATAKGRNSSDVIAFFLLLDEYGEFSFYPSRKNPLAGEFVTKRPSYC